jgi:hypothetical protein
MKKIITFILLSIFFLSKFSFAQNKKISSDKILTKMYKRYNGKWYKNFTFYQTTENYKNDSLVKTAIWHEALIYPNLFRITIGDSANGNAMIIKEDSMYNFSKGKMVRKSANEDDLTFLLGGMYFLPYSTVLQKMKQEGYDLTKAYESTFEGKPIYVMGANDSTEKTSQVWIEKNRLVVVRMIKYKKDIKEDAIFGDYTKIENGWRETSVIFHLNDKLYQKEKYYDYKANTEIDRRIFDPYDFIKF